MSQQRALTPAAPQAQQPTNLDRFFAAAGAGAKRAGVQFLVMAAKDPQTGEVKIVSSPNGMEAVKDAICAKFGLVDPDLDVAWPGT